MPLKSAASTKLVLYTSRSTTGKQIAVSGLVSILKGKAPKGGWPIISYAHGTTGIADKCALAVTPRAASPTLTSRGPWIQNAWLRVGYGVVACTDYQGLACLV